MSTSKDEIIKGSASLVTFAIAINILASACVKLASLDVKGLMKGITAIGAMMAEILVFLHALPKDTPKIAASVLGLSVALLIMSVAIKKMGDMSWEAIVKGLTALGGGIVILAFALNVMKGTLSGSAALLIAALAIGMLVPSLVILGKMSWSNIVKGLVTLAAAFTILGVAAYVLGPVLGIMAALAGILALAGVALIIFGAGLSSIAIAFSIMDYGTIAKGLMAIGGALIVFGAAVILPALMSPLIMLLGTSLLILGKGLIAIAAAFAITDYGAIAKGLMALGGALLVFTIAALPSIALSPLIMMLGIAILTLGVSALSAGIGLVYISAGLTALASAFATSGTLIVNAIKTIVLTLIELIPSIIEAIGKGIILVCQTIANSVGAITGAITAIITGVMNALDQSIPKIVTVVFNLLEALLAKLVEFTPKLVSAVFNILVACLDGIASGLPRVVESAVTIVTNFINGVAQQLPRVVQAGWDLIINFIDGITTSINVNTPRLMESIKGLFKAVLNAAVTVLTGGVVDLEASGGNLIEGFKKGITSKLSKLWNNVKKGFNDFKNKVAEFFGIHSPSKVFAEFGQYLDEGLIVGLNKYSGKVSNSAEDVGKDAIKSMSGAISGISSAVDSDIDSQPTIRPVMDLSNIESGANTISDLLGGKQSVGVLANVRSISNSMNSRQNIGASDIISAIKSLSSSIANGQGGVVYNVNGVTYDDGSNIADAISTLVRAAKIERRI